MVTAICNVFIDSDLKFELFKENFLRVYGISDNWLIYIRGKHRENVIQYIQKTLTNYEKNCIFFFDLYDNNWAKSTQKMLKESKYEYIYIFLEDHFLLKPLEHFKKCIQNMQENKIDYFKYSFFNLGMSKNSVELMHPHRNKYFYYFIFSLQDVKFFRKYYRQFYPFSLAGIVSKKYFNKLLELENKFLIKIPKFLQLIMENIYFYYPRNRYFWFIINKIFDNLKVRFGIYSASTPFNLEKSSFDCEPTLLPLKIGILNEELFANWDDDAGITNSCLIKRGLFPSKLLADQKINIENIHIHKYNLMMDEKLEAHFFLDQGRITKIPVKYIYITEGVLKVQSKSEEYTLCKGEEIFINANIPHILIAKQTVTFLMGINC